MKKRRLKKKPIIILILIMFLIGILSIILFYKLQLRAVSSDKSEIEFIVENGNTYYSVIPKLKKEKLIRNELCFKLYIKLNKVKPLEAGKYKLSKNMSVKQIVSTFSKGSNYNPDAVSITFKEGKNMRYIAQTISDNTNNTVDSVYSLLSDNDYLDSIINEYWFLDDSIKNKDIYYSLEGYLYPNTYEFKNKDVTVKEIFEKMLGETDKKLSQYKDKITNSNYSIHDILTLASVVELEGAKSNDRAGIAGVFYNRLNSGWSLGSDVTTYYASKLEMSERDLYIDEINDNNSYNTRSDYLAGKLPVGPICNPSIESIDAVLNPTRSDYYYFVADKNGKTYFAKTYDEHIANRDKLIEAGLWYTYE